MVKIKDMVHVEKQENSNRLIQVTRELLCKVPQDIDSASPAKNIPIGSKSPKVDNPSSPQTDKTTTESSKPLSPKAPPVPKVLRHPQPTLPRVVMLQATLQGRNLLSLLVGRNSVKAHPCLKPGKQLLQYSHVVESWDNLDFI
jgi:hypothetical protein